MPLGKTITKEMVSEMKGMRANGTEPKDIAKHFGIAKVSVYKYTGTCIKREIKEKEPVHSDIFDYAIHGYPYFREPREKKK